MTGYLLSGCDNYEGCLPIRVYASQSEAESMRDRCIRYLDKYPQLGMDDEYDDAFELRIEVWRKSHPLFPDYAHHHDSYSVVEIEVEGFDVGG